MRIRAEKCLVDISRYGICSCYDQLKRVWERPEIKLGEARLTEHGWISEAWHGRVWARPCWSQSGAPNWKPEYQTAGTDGANETRWYWGESCVLTPNWVSDGSTESLSLQNMLITDILFIRASWRNPWQGNNISIISTALLLSIQNEVRWEREWTQDNLFFQEFIFLFSKDFFIGLRDTQQSLQQLSKNCRVSCWKITSYWWQLICYDLVFIAGFQSVMIFFPPSLFESRLWFHALWHVYLIEQFFFQLFCIIFKITDYFFLQ